MPQAQAKPKSKPLRSADAELDAILASEDATIGTPSEQQPSRPDFLTRVGQVASLLEPVARTAEERARQQEMRDRLIGQEQPPALPNVFERLQGGQQVSFLQRLGEDVAGPGFGAFAGRALAGAAAGGRGGPGGAALGAALGAVGGELLNQATRRLAGRTDVPQTFGEQAKELGLAAAGGPLQEFGAAAKLTQAGRAASLLKPAARLTPMLVAAEEAGVGITKGQAQGGGRALVEDFFSRTLGGAGRFKKFRQGQAKELNAAVDDFVSTISRSKLDPNQAGEVLQTAIKGARKEAGQEVGAALDNIVTALPDLRVPQQGALADSAQKLLSELEGPTAQHLALREVAGQDLKTAIQVLKGFANPNITTPIQDATKLRSLLFQLTDSPGISTVGQSALKRINGALHDAIGEAVKGAGREDLFTAFETASSNFRRVVTDIETPSIQRLLKLDRPELIVGYMLQPGGESRVGRVLNIVGEENFKPIARATVQKIFDNATSEGIVLSQSFANIRKKVGDKALGKLLGDPEQLNRLNRLTKLIDGLGLTEELTKPSTASAGVGLLQGAIGGAGLGVGFMTNRLPETAAFITALVGIPNVIARAVTRRGALATIEKELAIAARQEGRAGVIKRLAGFVVAEVDKDVARSFLRPSPPEEQQAEQQ